MGAQLWKAKNLLTHIFQAAKSEIDDTKEMLNRRDSKIIEFLQILFRNGYYQPGRRP
jgi:hypothetical protein